MKKKIINFSKEFLENEYVNSKKSIQIIAKENQVSLSTIHKSLKKFNIPRRKCHKSQQPLMIGEKFGKLQILELLEIKQKKHYICRCNCGNIITVGREKLTQKTRPIHCGCETNHFSQNNHFWQGRGKISHSHWIRIKFGAKSRNLEFSITIDQAWDLFEQQKGLCTLSGLKLEFDKTCKNTTASLDRIDSKKGYTIDNIHWVHKIINVMKLDMTNNEFLLWCSLVAKYND